MGSLIVYKTNEMLDLIIIIKDELRNLYMQIKEKDMYDSNDNRPDASKCDKNKASS